ncbi:unnamed protein product [Haemonchus placei]|uniref:DUF5641 domain-containing protein n=1 Tax=Haemonchus placei TaxID=6290 RepID=A0A0N4X905_HAEPC|nr:unnamed protein product [Haemonchus placei]
MTAAETLLIFAHYREDEHILQRLPLHKFNSQKDHLGLLRCLFRVALKERHQLRIRQPKYAAAPLNINDVVIIADEKLPRSHWPLGLVVKIVAVQMAKRTYPSDSHRQQKDLTPQLPQRTQPSRVAKTYHEFIRS